MTTLSLGQAARATGASKSTIQRAIKTGRLSATRLEGGGYSIDPSELFRVYSPASQEPADAPDAATGPVERDATGGTSAAAYEAQIAALKEVGDLLRGQLGDLREDRDRWRNQAERLTLAPPARRPWWPWRRAG
jgi:excisionase family DNA binding protein